MSPGAGTRKAVKNTGFVIAARMTDVLSGVLAIALATRYLGTRLFGEYAVILTTAAALSPWIAMGCARILVRDIAVDRDRAGALVVSAAWINLVLALAGAVLMTGILWMLGLRSPLVLAAGLAAVLAQTLMIVRQTIGSVPLAFEVMIYEPLIAVVTRVLMLALFVTVVLADLHYVCFFCGAAVAQGAGLLLAAAIMTRRFTPPAWGLRLSEIRYLLRESVPVAAYNFLGDGPVYVGVFLLKMLRDLEQVSFFQAPQKVVWPLMILPISLLLAFTPLIARTAADVKRRAELWRGYVRATGGILAATLPVCIAATIAAPYLVRLLFGPEFSRAAFSFAVLIWAVIPFSFKALLNAVLTSLGRQAQLVRIHAVALVFSVALGIPLTIRYGHVGTSVSFLATFVVLFLMSHVFFVRTVRN